MRLNIQSYRMLSVNLAYSITGHHRGQSLAIPELNVTHFDSKPRAKRQFGRRLCGGVYWFRPPWIFGKSSLPIFHKYQVHTRFNPNQLNRNT